MKFSFALLLLPSMAMAKLSKASKTSNHHKAVAHKYSPHPPPPFSPPSPRPCPPSHGKAPKPVNKGLLGDLPKIILDGVLPLGLLPDDASFP